VKKEVKTFFEKRLSEKSCLDIKLGNVEFSTISEENNRMLMNNFTELEVKETVWNYDGQKRSSLDDLTLLLLKSFGRLSK